MKAPTTWRVGEKVEVRTEELTDSRCGNLENKSDEAELESECGVQSHILQEVSLF